MEFTWSVSSHSIKSVNRIFDETSDNVSFCELTSGFYSQEISKNIHGLLVNEYTPIKQCFSVENYNILDLFGLVNLSQFVIHRQLVHSKNYTKKDI